MARVVIVEQIRSETEIYIDAANNVRRTESEPLSAIPADCFITHAQALELDNGSVIDPVIIELNSGDTIPVPLSLPSNFNGKYQLNIKIDRGGSIWENYPAGLVQDLLDISGGVENYFVNRVDIYGTPAGDGTNLDHLLFTFTKA